MIGEQKPNVGTKDFAVTLTLAPKQIEEVPYSVPGIDPFRFFLEADFHWASYM